MIQNVQGRVVLRLIFFHFLYPLLLLRRKCRQDKNQQSQLVCRPSSLLFHLELCPWQNLINSLIRVDTSYLPHVNLKIFYLAERTLATRNVRFLLFSRVRSVKLDFRSLRSLNEPLPFLTEFLRELTPSIEHLNLRFRWSETDFPWPACFQRDRCSSLTSLKCPLQVDFFRNDRSVFPQLRRLILTDSFNSSSGDLDPAPIWKDDFFSCHTQLTSLDIRACHDCRFPTHWPPDLRHLRFQRACLCATDWARIVTFTNLTHLTLHLSNSVVEKFELPPRLRSFHLNSPLMIRDDVFPTTSCSSDLCVHLHGTLALSSTRDVNGQIYLQESLSDRPFFPFVTSMITRDNLEWFPVTHFPHLRRLQFREYPFIQLTVNDLSWGGILSKLTHLQLARDFHSLPSMSWPITLTHLIFPSNFNSPLDFPWPLQLRVLDLGYHFNCPLINLPLSLRVLILGPAFQQPLRDLPPLRWLTLTRWHTQPLDTLPSSLLVLVLRHEFEIKLAHTTINQQNVPVPPEDIFLQALPDNLTHLLIMTPLSPCDFLDHLPSSLTHLHLPNAFCSRLLALDQPKQLQIFQSLSERLSHLQFLFLLPELFSVAHPFFPRHLVFTSDLLQISLSTLKAADFDDTHSD